MTDPKPQKPRFATEQQVQDWLESVIGSGTLATFLQGQEAVEAALKRSTSPDFWPPFPIDYLSRLANLRAARSVLGSLHELELVSKNTRNLSAGKGERLFTDLLYCARETSTFVVIEVKNQNGSVREAVTELLAYEHEILNHIPFSGSSDVKMVVVSREFSTLLDHAITGLNTWTRRQILCLRFDDSAVDPTVHVHIPQAWSAIGQMTLPADGVVTAALSFKPDPDLSEEQVWKVCDTAAALMVREAERGGGSGFAIVAYNHFYPAYADGPYLVLAGVVNPFSFAQWAVDAGFLKETSSPLTEYVLKGGTLGGLSSAWNWTACDNGAATEYLNGFGRASWGSFSSWQGIRDVRRWSGGVTLDRHITPVSIDFWGVLGDYARDAVRRVERMRKFKLGLAKPGLDWRHPLLGVLLLDEVATPPVVAAGQWTFSALFNAGIRLGRLCAFASQYADADARTQRLLRAPLFWAEVDAFDVFQELAFRYVSAADITVAPPIIKIGAYESGGVVQAEVEALAHWVRQHFIGEGQLKFMQAAFSKGLALYAVFDPQFDADGSSPQMSKLREVAVATARDWLKLSAVSATSDDRDSEEARTAIIETFGQEVPLDKGKDASLAAIDSLADDRLLKALLQDIPRIVDAWHPQLAHRLGPSALEGQDWDWFEEQVRQARARGEKRPCIIVGAGGQIGIGSIPMDAFVPALTDPTKQVFLVMNESFAEMTLVVAWADLRAGNVPGV